MTKKELNEILNKLTIEQKIGQLVQLVPVCFGAEKSLVTGPMEKLGLGDYDLFDAGSTLNALEPEEIRAMIDNYSKNAKHGIPLLNCADIIYGFRTIFPIPIAQTCSFDFDAIENAASVAAAEMSSSGVHLTFAPMLDLVRDPRWGRVMESPGEDVLLGKLFAKHVTRGFQGESGKSGRLPKGKVAACVKHFAAYGAPEGGRDYSTVDMSPQRFYGEYLPAYTEAIDAGARMVMTAFNTLNGVPATGSEWLNRTVLRDECGFEGVLISDFAAIMEMIAHGYAADNRDAARLGMLAGVDIDMMTPCYAAELKGLVESGEVDIKLIDEAVMRVLELKNDLGLFEDPYRGLSKAEILLPDYKKAAVELTEKSCVLLENDGILPLDANKKIALIGPYANDPMTLGMWAVNGKRVDTVTLLRGMEEHFPELTYAEGSHITDNERQYGDFGPSKFVMDDVTIRCGEELLAEALKTAENADVVVLALGEHALQSGEGASRANLVLNAPQERLLNEISALGKPVVLVVYAGRPLILSDVREKVNAILYAWHPGTMGGTAIANLISGKASPSGRLSMSFPRNMGQIPVYHSMLSTGRPIPTDVPNMRFVSRYQDSPNSPLYPFGYGLTYTDFAYESIKIDGSKVTVTVKNTGKTAGTEVVQLYIRDKVASIARPVKELKAFKRVELNAGQSTDIVFGITDDMLKLYNQKMEYVLEPGVFEIMVGPNTEDLPLRVELLL
jgi:beta-glucosidase